MPPNRHEFEKLMTLKAEQGKKLHEAHLSLVKQAATKELEARIAKLEAQVKGLQDY